MNKVYKLVWSKVKNCYVVVSELAKRNRKSTSSGHVIVSGVLACMLSVGAMMPSAMAYYNMDRVDIDEDNYYTLTNDPAVVGNSNGSIAIGKHAMILNPDSNEVAIGDYTYANNSSIAIGGRYDAQEWKIEGIGDRTFGTSAEGTGDIVLGAASHITGNNTIALGVGIISSASNAVILGRGANVSADGSVALGSNSVATEANTVSLGNDTLKRKLVNVAFGTSANDVAAIGQIQTVTAGTNVRIVETTNANGSKNKQIFVEGTGTVANGNTGLINGNTAYNELRPSDGTYVKRANTTASNLTALDRQT